MTTEHYGINYGALDMATDSAVTYGTTSLGTDVEVLVNFTNVPNRKSAAVLIEAIVRAVIDGRLNKTGST